MRVVEFIKSKDYILKISEFKDIIVNNFLARKGIKVKLGGSDKHAIWETFKIPVPVSK